MKLTDTNRPCGLTKSIGWAQDARTEMRWTVGSKMRPAIESSDSSASERARRSSSERYSEIKDRRIERFEFSRRPWRPAFERAARERGRRDGFPTVHRAGATPVPIPNTEVKPRFGDGTAHFLSGRVARRWDLFGRRPERGEGRGFGRRFYFGAPVSRRLLRESSAG